MLSPTTEHCFVMLHDTKVNKTRELNTVTNTIQNIESIYLLIYLGSSIQYVCKTFRKTNIFDPPLIRIHMCAYQGVRNVSFSENFE